MPSDTSSPEDARQGTRSVLIVDDKREVREVVAERIGRDPRYLVFQAANGREALEKLGQIDNLLAVFVDQRIDNDMQAGLGILKSILKCRPLLPVVLYTAFEGDDIGRKALDAGALWYLSKAKIRGKDDLSAILHVASKLVDAMPMDMNPQFLKEMLDATPIEIMVRDAAGRVTWQNRAKERMFGGIVPDETLCWHRYEGCEDDPNVRCPGIDLGCPSHRIFNPQSDEDCDWPIHQVYPYTGDWYDETGRYHPPGWFYLVASGIRGSDGNARFAVETSRDITIQIEILRLITEIARRHGLQESDVLKLTCQRLVDRARFARAGAWRFDTTTREFVCTVAEGKYRGALVGKSVEWPEKELKELDSRKPLQMSATWLHGVLPEDVFSDLDPAQVGLLAPFHDGDQLAGLLIVDKKGQPSERIFTLDEFWMGFLGQHVSAVIGRIRTTKKLNDRHDDLKWLGELHRKMSGIQNVRELLQVVIADVEERIGANVVQFHQLGSDNKIYLVADNNRHAPDCPMRGGYSYEVGVNGRVCRENRPGFLDPTEGDRDFEEFRKRFSSEWSKRCPGCREHPLSMACLPVHAGDTVIGSLCVLFSRRHTFSSREQDLLRGVSDSLSIRLRVVRQLSVADPEAVEARRTQGIRMIARGLTHALRNIAQVVSNYNGAIRRDADDPERIKSCSDEITKQVRNMTSLFDALGRHAAVQAQEDARMSVHQVIRDLITLQRRRFLDNGITLREELDPQFNRVRRDQGKFLVILLTVTENAFDAVKGKAGPREVVIKTSASPEQPVMIITVADTGRGIPPERLGTLFDLPPADLAGLPPIHGVGLPVSWHLARSMGWEIGVESQEGHGTNVKIKLPVEGTDNA
jgi:signal transduction histidine kinase/CheY-like chemotaxis protein